jgi:broad specificity phosphatase PhoE
MKIYLVHPGDNNFLELTEQGVWQMKAVVRRLLKDKIKADRIYANGHEVSRQSGLILSRSLKIPMVNDERFVELNKRIILGEITQADFENLGYINLFLEEIVNKGRDAILTIGGGVHRAVISMLTGLPLEETRHFSLMPASISVLHYAPDGTGGWRISLINDRSHLSLP